MSIFRAHLRKMKAQINEKGSVDYQLHLKEGPEDVLESLNRYLGQKIKLEYQDQINCINCGRKTNKSFNQGYCFPCMQNLAECDLCIVKPELCHFDQGTCRDNDFAQSHCNIPHSIYLSLTSSMKIGVTRQVQEKTRWIDQGAIEALRIMTVNRRYHAGLIEATLAKEMQDKTNWQRMLKNEVEQRNLQEEKIILLDKIQDLLQSSILGTDLNYLLDDALNEQSKIQQIKYPVLEYPIKVTSFNLDKNPLIEGTLLGIKGQYLIIDTGVVNLRKYAGYLVSAQLG